MINFDGSGGLVLIGKAAVLKTAGRKPFRVRVPGPPLPVAQRLTRLTKKQIKAVSEVCPPFCPPLATKDTKRAHPRRVGSFAWPASGRTLFRHFLELRDQGLQLGHEVGAGGFPLSDQVQEMLPH